MIRYGSNKWRDVVDPIEILYDWVSRQGLPEPKWTDDCEQVKVGADTYCLKDFGMQRAANLKLMRMYQVNVISMCRAASESTHVLM